MLSCDLPFVLTRIKALLGQQRIPYLKDDWNVMLKVFLRGTSSNTTIKTKLRCIGLYNSMHRAF